MTGPGHRMAALGNRDRATVIGLALSAIWLLLVALFWLFGPDGQGGASGLARLVAAIGVVMPLALIWLAVGLARAIATLRAEAEDLRALLDQMRDARRPVAAAAAQGFQEPRPAFTPAAPPRAPVAARPAVPAAAVAAAAVAPRAANPDQRQTAMRFDAPESVTADPSDLIRALNFPDGPDDHAAIAALRNALKDHDSARVIRAAQDVVTLLAGSDLYMDDLPPPDAPAALWRAFAEGQRGDAMVVLGTTGDDAALDTVSEMLKGDEIFRDTAHHFLRHYDLMLGRVLPELNDDQVLVLAQTRSSRAFSLIGQAAGMFG